MAGQNINRRVHTDTILKNPLDLDLEQGTNKGALAQVDAESSSMMSNKTAGPTHTSATPTPANSPFIPSQPCSESTATSFGTWSPRHLHQKRILMILIVFLGATASSAFLWIGIKGAMDEAEKRFTTDALDLTNAIKAAWDDYEIFALWIHESCHLRHPTGNSTPEEDISTYARFCSRDKFQHLYDYINSVGLEFVAIQYIPNITNAERPYVEDESKLFHHQRNPNMTYMGIKALDLSPTDGSVVSLGPSPVKAWYFPMHYLLPLEKNENAVDIDLYSYRQKEIEKAFETRMPVLGNRARLFQDPDPRVYGIEFIHPGIHNYSDVKKEEERTGLSKLVIKIPALVNRAAAAFLKDSRVYLFDASNPDEEPVFLAGADLVGNKIDLKEVCLCSEVPSASKTFSKTICIMDKQWRIVIQPLGNNYEEQLRFVILGGVLIFLACVIIVFWFRTHMNRLAKESRIKSKAESEKSELALSQVKRERHLNDFIAHEVRNPLTSGKMHDGTNGLVL